MSVEKWHRPRMYSFLINLSFNYALQSATRLDYSHKNEIELRQSLGPTSLFAVIYLKLLKADERKKK